MTLPYAQPLVPLPTPPRVLPEPARAGEECGPPCRVCTGRTTAALWSNEHFTLHPPTGGSLPGSVWLATNRHVDSFCDLTTEEAAGFGAVCGQVERAILARGDVGRVHLYRWGDGGAHFHVWFIPRPLGMLEAAGAMLPLWEDVLPNVPDEVLRAAAEEVAAGMPSVEGSGRSRGQATPRSLA